MRKRVWWQAAGLAIAGAAAIGACHDDDAVTGASITNPIELAARSITPALVKNVMSGVSVFPLISSEDQLPQSPSYVFGGSTDGAGLLRNADKSFTLLVNNEDNFAVSRITLDSTFKPIRGEYVLNSDNAKNRLCSATLATPAEHGFGPTFITAGESSVESQVLALDPFGTANSARPLTALGHWSAENAVPLPKQAYSGKTVLVIGDDDSGQFGGQVALYVGNAIGDLDNGKLYVMARTNDVVRERDMVAGQSYPVQFRELTGAASKSGAQLNADAAALKAIVFGRVEDVDYRKNGTGRDVYFAVTGQNSTGVNADASRSKYGRIYHLTLDAADPTKGTLEVVLDGDDRSGPAKTFQNPDNVLATENYLYIEEDPNEYGDETHDSYLYQYNLATKELKVVLELDHRREAADAAKYNATGQGDYSFKTSARGSWENSGIIDVSDVVGRPSVFLMGVQAHTWRAAKFKGVDGGVTRANEDQGSQLLMLVGLPR